MTEIFLYYCIQCSVVQQLGEPLSKKAPYITRNCPVCKTFTQFMPVISNLTDGGFHTL